jgi:uncharacterized protein YjbI with pentapeptide repeats
MRAMSTRKTSRQSARKTSRRMRPNEDDAEIAKRRKPSKGKRYDSSSRKKIAWLLADGRPLSRLIIRGISLQGMDLRGVDLSGTRLHRTNLSGVNLAGANLTNATLYRVNLQDAVLEGTDLTRIKARGIISGMIRGQPLNLSRRYKIANGYFVGGRADIQGADLTGADLTGVDLSHTNLSDVLLTRAILRDVNLGHAILRRTNVDGADMAGVRAHKRQGRPGRYLYTSTLRSSGIVGKPVALPPYYHLVNGYLICPGVTLQGAYLDGADMSGMHLKYVSIMNSNMDGADMSGAKLFNCSFTKIRGRPKALPSGCNIFNGTLVGPGTLLISEDLSYQDLRGTDLSRAALWGVNLDSADLRGVRMTGAKIESGTDALSAVYDSKTAWPKGFSTQVSDTFEERSYGTGASAVLKLQRVAPITARDFKRKYPVEFEQVLPISRGRDFSREIVSSVLQAYESPISWLVTLGKYRLDLQRYCQNDNDVLNFNIDMRSAPFTAQHRVALSEIRAQIKQDHPVAHPTEAMPLFLVGWVRICTDDKARTWLVEEVQTDLPIRIKRKFGDFEARVLSRGRVTKEGFDETIRLLSAYVDRFNADAMGIVFELASRSGYRVEMLVHEDKADARSPVGVYTDLPRSMGMRRSPGSAVVSQLKETWKITPNRRRTSRKPRKTSRR